MRAQRVRDDPFTVHELAQLACNYSDVGLDEYSGYGVGVAASLSVNDLQHRAYCGANINISGMEVKIHAEQLTLFQAILDIESGSIAGDVELDHVVVNTSEDDLALRCGHCVQVLYSMCEHYGWDQSDVGFTAVARDAKFADDDFMEYEYTVEEHVLADFMSDSYTEKS